MPMASARAEVERLMAVVTPLADAGDAGAIAALKKVNTP